MSDPTPSFFARIWLAFVAFFRVLFDGMFAARVARLKAPEAAPEPEKPAAPEPEKPAAPALRTTSVDSALQLLALCQREGRLIDFLEEDISSYSDADVGAAARVVHDSLKQALDSHIRLERVHSAPEGSRVSVAKGFSASEIRLTGNVVGEAPFQGTLSHAGWRVVQLELPKVSEGHDLSIVAPAEVEL